MNREHKMKKFVAAIIVTMGLTVPAHAEFACDLTGAIGKMSMEMRFSGYSQDRAIDTIQSTFIPPLLANVNLDDETKDAMAETIANLAYEHTEAIWAADVPRDAYTREIGPMVYATMVYENCMVDYR